MLVDVIEYAQREKEELFEKGRTEGREEGIEKGMEKGREEGKFEIVKSMLLEGFPMDIIVKVTKLSDEQIEALKDNENDV